MLVLCFEHQTRSMVFSRPFEPSPRLCLTRLTPGRAQTSGVACYLGFLFLSCCFGCGTPLWVGAQLSGFFRRAVCLFFAFCVPFGVFFLLFGVASGSAFVVCFVFAQLVFGACVGHALEGRRRPGWCLCRPCAGSGCRRRGELVSAAHWAGLWFFSRWAVSFVFLAF